MANQEEKDRIQFPLDPSCYKILDEIGSGMSAIVYKALCLPLDSAVVAIKSIDLDQSRADLDNVRREAKAMSLLAHPNILRAHCSFTVDRRLWVVMPFMSSGSLQSIMASSFPGGLPETAIAVSLREILHALAYLHDQGHLHRDIKAGNILVHSDGSVKLTDFGVSASIYESNCFFSPSSMLTDVAGTPYWMAPEVIHSHNGYSFKADIWSFGITALELAHGRPPLSHLPPSKSMMVKITKRFKFSDYEKEGDKNCKKFSKSFKDLVGCCLDQDPNKRPSAEKLLKHSFFKNCNKGLDFLVRNVLQGLPSVEQRFREIKLQKILSMKKIHSEEEDEDDDDEFEQRTKQRRISGWNFNEDGLQLDPIMAFYGNESDTGLKQVRLGFDSSIQDTQKEIPEVDICKSEGSGGSAETGVASEDNSEPKQVRFGRDSVIQDEEKEKHPHVDICKSEGWGRSAETGDASTEGEIIGGGPSRCIDKEMMMESLVLLRRSLEEQKRTVNDLIATIGGGIEEEQGTQEEVYREEILLQEVEGLGMELESEKKRRLELEMELEFLRLSS